MNCNEMHANLYWGHRAKKTPTEQFITNISQHNSRLMSDRYQRADELENSFDSFTHMNYSISNCSSFHICVHVERIVYMSHSKPFCTLQSLSIRYFDMWYIVITSASESKKTIINLRLIDLCFHIKTHIFRINFNRDFSFNFFSLRIIFAMVIGIFLFFSVYFSLLLFYSYSITFLDLFLWKSKFNCHSNQLASSSKTCSLN